MCSPHGLATWPALQALSPCWPPGLPHAGGYTSGAAYLGSDTPSLMGWLPGAGHGLETAALPLTRCLNLKITEPVVWAASQEDRLPLERGWSP